MNNRNRVVVRRMANVGGVLGGLLIYLLSLTLSDKRVLHRSFFFGSVDHWPSYMRGFWPLDLVVTVFFFWLFIRLIAEDMSMNNGTFPGLRGWIQLAVGTFVALGAFGGVIGTSISGWYGGLEFSLVAAVGLSAFVCACGLVIILGLVTGNWLIRQAQRLWQHVRDEPFVRPLVWLDSYFRGEDVLGDEIADPTPDD